MMKIGMYILSMTLLLAVNAQGQGQSSLSLKKETVRSPFSGEWQVGISGADSQDEQSQSKKVDFRLAVKAKYELTSYLLLDIQPIVRLQSGQTQSVDGADSAENKILLNQAAVDLHSENFKLLAGVLFQTTLHSELLVDRMAFPGARAQAMFNTSQFETGVAVETAIPTSTSLSANTSELEATPSLNTASLNFNWEASKRAYWKTKAGYFAYSDLPSAVAQKSRLLGNEVIAMSEADYSLKYEHQGIEATTKLSLPVFNRFTIIAGGDYLQNQKAPSDLNTATLFWGGAEIYFNRNFTWALIGGQFSVAPESAVSYFNATSFETNRVGYVIETKFKFQRERFNLSVKYTDAELMYESEYQSREKTLTIKLETAYADI
jgi:hypothetical protein